MQYEIDVTPKELYDAMKWLEEQPSSLDDLLIVEKVISACLKHRPVNADGEHGDLHTETCGCEPECPQCNGLVWNGKLGKWIVIREVTNGVCQLCGTVYVEPKVAPRGSNAQISFQRHG